MAFTVYRLAFADPLQFYEQLGDPVTTQGGAPVPALRAALRHSVSLATFPPNQSEETTALRLKVRRQWRSLANNTPMKLTGLYLAWDVDPEQNGWYLPDQGQLVDLDGATGLATGVFKVENFVWILAGRPRTHRRAMWVYLKDLRTGLWARDYRRLIYSTDFAGLSTLALSYFAPGVSDLVTTSSGAVAAAIALPAGMDGGQCNLVVGSTDLARVSYEQTTESVNQGQVVVYDRRGEANGPTRGPGERWEEFYGIDYPYSWVGPSPEPMDTPVLENGRCRVRYDASPVGEVQHSPGWRIDVWTGTEWEEQGKVTIERNAGLGEPQDRGIISASLAEYSETRASIRAVMYVPTDPASREEVIITLQRGWSGPRVEVYPAPNASGEKVDASINFTLTGGDTDDSAIKIDAAGAGAIQATALGTGHTGKWPEAMVGAGTFTGENEVIVGRWGASYGVTVAVIQAAVSASVLASHRAYGEHATPLEHNTVRIQGNGGLGYCSARFGFPKQLSQQALEAESMTLGTGTANTVDAGASAGYAATATRTTDANPHVTSVAWPNGRRGVFRMFARVKTSASALHIYAKTPTTIGATQNTTSTSYVWLDLGDITVETFIPTLEIHCWATAAATVSVDRIEGFLVEDRIVNFATYEGGRDRGQAALTDSRTIPTLVAGGS